MEVLEIEYLCKNCGNIVHNNSIISKCPKCQGIVWIKSFNEINRDYKVSLGEGNTPCIPSKRLGDVWGIKNLFFKDETHNPTNSFKDRAAALLISHARSLEYTKVICASNGNQGASVAAYASLEGMYCLNIIPEKIDVGKKAQMIAYNSDTLTKGTFADDAIQEALNPEYNTYYQCTPELNPLTIEGQKTIAYEILDQVGEIDGIIIPMGSGGLLISVWKGYQELYDLGQLSKIPKMIGVQTQTYSPIVNKFRKIKEKKPPTDEEINSYALGILVKEPFYGDLVIRALRETDGMAIAIQESLILNSTEELARKEGIFAEPSSALTIAALNSLLQQNSIGKDEKIVCLITGSGLKTPYILEALSTRAKTAGMGNILSTKLKILSQIAISKEKGIYGSKLKEMMGSISLPAIYQHLKELEQKKLITRKKKEKGKLIYYIITDKGKKVLEALETLIALF
ncbi:MAG: Transcriptional regulator [Promethearchaeota archaeon]|nr:MAG: Transcriptional regulator [Candidatus Lokiarchaeota archaeon]